MSSVAQAPFQFIALVHSCQFQALGRGQIVQYRMKRTCSVFTRVAAHMVAEPPKATLSQRSASGHVVTSTTRSVCYRLERVLPGGIRTR